MAPSLNEEESLLRLIKRGGKKKPFGNRLFLGGMGSCSEPDTGVGGAGRELTIRLASFNENALFRAMKQISEVRWRGQTAWKEQSERTYAQPKFQSLLPEVLSAVQGNHIGLKKIETEACIEFIKKELAAVMDLDTFRGMRDTGPETPQQQLTFGKKVQQWATLWSNIGMYSGQFSRFFSRLESTAPKAQRKVPMTANVR